MIPTAPTLAFLEQVGLHWGRDWQETLVREIGRGTFVELDGQPLLMLETEEPERHEQTRLSL